MDTVSPEGVLAQSLNHSAFILYRPQKGRVKDQVFYNNEASKVLSYSRLPEEKVHPFNIKSFCLRWRKLADKRLNELFHSDKGEGPDAGLIDIIQSYHRRYAVRGIILSTHSSTSFRKESHYLFILERINPDLFNLSMISRRRNLSHREEEIVRLLLKGDENKEIANALGLSINTIKGYLKLLMRKLGVKNRAGIISALLTERLA